MPLRIAVIGGGSVGFTRGLMRDMLSVPELQDTQFAFTDISRRNLDMVLALVQRDIRHNRVPASVRGTLDCRAALEGADFVYNLTRIGGLEGFRTDVEIPLKYGVDQCVGGHFNVPNDGCIGNLPADAIVEVPCYVDRNGVGVPRIGDLPLGCAAVCNASIAVQRLAVEAAVRGDVVLLKQAAMMDPLTGAVCDPCEISQMVDEMLVAQAKWLPQYAAEIPRARRRLGREKPLGTRRWRGAARLRTRTVAEMRRHALAARRESQAETRRVR